MTKTSLFLGAGALVVALVAGVDWNAQRRPEPEKAARRVTSSSAPETAAPADLSALPRALELPLQQLPLQPGDPAPDFELRDQRGQLHRLSKLRGETVVLSFYPRDLTYSCVSEAISFDRNLPQFQRRGAKVFSVSVQSVASKAIFASSYGISYPLLSDENKSVARAYRVLSEDGVAGRVTFLISPAGRIQWTDAHVRAQSHALDVLSAMDSQAPTWNLQGETRRDAPALLAPSF